MGRTSDSNTNRFPAKTPPPEIRGNFFFNTESKLLDDRLAAVEALVKAPQIEEIRNAENQSLASLVAFAPTVDPSVVSVVNPAGNNGTIDLILATSSGNVTFNIQAGDTFSLDDVGVYYDIVSVTNQGETAGHYYAVQYLYKT